MSYLTLFLVVYVLMIFSTFYEAKCLWYRFSS